ncbi:unnamed protein product, partial [Cladocopium goreaui]
MASSVALVETQEGDVAKAADKASCVKCGCPTDDFDSHSLQCRQCWNVHQILYRHLGGAPSTLQSLQPDEQKKFFKDVGSKMKITPKNGRWALVRAAMVKSITHYRKEERVNSVKRKFLPLSVLEKKGYDVDAIKAHGDRREDEVFGEVFAAPILTISNDEIQGEVEQELAQKEWALKSKKKGERTQKPVANGASDQAIPVEDEVWEVPSDDEPAREPASKAPKKGVDKEEQQAAKEAAKQVKLRENAWHRETAKAAKVIGPLNTVIKALTSAQLRTSKNEELFDTKLLEGITEALTKLTQFKTRATALISASALQKLAEMPQTFENVADVQANVKAAQQVLTDVRKVFAEKAEAAKAAKGEGAPKAKAGAKSLSVKGASERAMNELWNLRQDDEGKKLTHSQFGRVVHDNLEPWLATAKHVQFDRLDGGKVTLPITRLRPCLEKMTAESNVSEEFERGFMLSGGLQFKQSLKAFYLADMDAIRGTYSIKGSAGLRPCIHCDTLKKDSGLLEHEASYVDIS